MLDPNIHQHSEIWGAADETVFNKVLKIQKKFPWEKKQLLLNS